MMPKQRRPFGNASGESNSVRARLDSSALMWAWRPPLAVTLTALMVVGGALCGPAFGQETAAPPPAPPPASQPAESQPASVGLDTPDDSDIDLLELEVPVVVTATRREQKITSVPYAVSVITAEDIRRSGARSIPDALRLVPGVDVAELSFANAAVSPRGFHSHLANKTLVLVDGRQIFDTLMSGTFWGTWPFQLEDIERIEVIRGPGGVTWGANAVNGVIHIITKDPADQLGFTLSGGGGSRGTHREHLGYAFQDEKLRLRVSGEFEGSGGFRENGALLGGLEDDYRGVRAAIHAIYDAGPDDTLTFSGSSSVIAGNWPLPLMSRPDALRPKAQSNFVLTRWTHHVARHNTFELTGYVNDFYIASGPRWSEYRYQQIALELGHTFQPADDHTVTWGIDSRWDLTSAANADPFMLSQDVVRTGIVGLYAQDEWRFAPRWALNLGARVDYDFYGGFQPSARAALSYELSDGSLVYGAVSRAFHMPSGARRFMDFPLAAGGLIRTRSPQDLEPETLIAYELGYRARHFDRLDVTVNWFWHHYRHLITTSPQLGPPGLMQLLSDNDDSLSLYGVELDLRYTVTKWLTLLGNYTFQRVDSHTSLTNTGSVSPPRNKFMLGARCDVTDDLHLSSHLYYVDAVTAPDGTNPIMPQHLDPYFRLDLRAEQEFWKDQASIAVGVRNLLDDGHREGGSTTLDSAEVPRMVYAELRLTFK